jgi:L-ribulokinase
LFIGYRGSAIVSDRYLIGLDLGTASARGVLVQLTTGRQVECVVSAYSRGVLSACLPNESALPAGFALHHPFDYLQAIAVILEKLGRGRDIVAIGVASTASSPLPARSDGSSLVDDEFDDPHSYVKLWKHAHAQPFADALNLENEAFLSDFGNRASGEGLLAKAAETRFASPSLWAKAEKFIEVGDWVVWQLTGCECRSMDFACFKALYSKEKGYPAGVVDGLEQKLSRPASVGGAAGGLSDAWIAKTGIQGAPIVSVASIDAHAVLPAVGVTTGGTLVGVLGTSSGFMFLDTRPRMLPAGYEGAAFGAVLPDIWACEAGQAGFGDALAWCVRTLSSPKNVDNGFEWYNSAAEKLPLDHGGLMALDWFGGNRVPYADTQLGGLLIGLRVETSAAEIYRAIVESLAFGVRNILERAEASGAVVERVVLTSALARSNRFLVQTICDVLGCVVHVPNLDNASAMGAAIHAAVASGVVSSFTEGADRFGCRSHRRYEPDRSRTRFYDRLYENYIALSSNELLLETMRKTNVARRAGMKAHSAEDRVSHGGSRA